MSRLINSRFLSIVVAHGISYPTPSNLNYFWGFGSISGVLLVCQALSGFFLAAHYNPDVSSAFNSVEHITRNVQNGWLIRYCHSGGASMLFVCLYAHIGRGLYFRSYKKISLWYSGLALFFLIMATAFLGYVLPWGQMSLWGATVITNLLGSVPIVGKELVIWLWGGYSVDNPTLKRFFVAHFLIPMVAIVLSLLHLILLHKFGSNNPLGLACKTDMVRFYPKYLIKDIAGFILFVGPFLLYVFFFYPNALGHPDNYLRADALTTPKHIVPEWYFLPFYAVLRSIPNKLGGIVAMVSAILVLFLLPYIARFKIFGGSKFGKVSRIAFWLFVFNFIFLGWLGACVVEPPFIFLSQLSTVFYFFYFIGFLPWLAYLQGNY